MAWREVVDRQSHTERLQRDESAHGLLLLVEQRLLGEFEDEQRRIEVTRRDRRLNVLDEVFVLQLVHRYVHRDVEAVTAGVPQCALKTRGAKCPATDRNDLTRRLEIADEHVRVDDASFRVAPAQEGFDPNESARLKVDGGLVHEKELVGLKCNGQLIRQTWLRLRRLGIHR